MAGSGFDRKFATDHHQPFPHAEQTQAAISFRAKDAFHIKGFAVVGYRQANPVRQLFNLNFYGAGLRMDGYVIEGFQGDAIEDGTLVDGQLVYRRVGGQTRPHARPLHEILHKSVQRGNQSQIVQNRRAQFHGEPMHHGQRFFHEPLRLRNFPSEARGIVR